MNIFYLKTLSWEKDFFMNDIFNQSFYTSKINVYMFDKYITPTMLNKYNKDKNILITNCNIPINLLNDILRILRPKTVFHLSDEFGNDHLYYKLYDMYNIYTFHQYNHNKINYHKHHYQIPLGYVTGFLNNTNIPNKKTKDFSFNFKLRKKNSYYQYF